MIPMKINGIKIYFIILSIALLSSSCTKYLFERNGTYISGNSDIYYNDSLRLCLNIYGDYQKYDPTIKKGIKFDVLYPHDSKIMRKLRLHKANTRVLFSTIPIISPYFNLIAVIRDSADVNLKHYQHKIYLDTLQFYYKTQEVKKMELEETLIPYKNYYIEFIYYNSNINECHFCDIEELTIKNRYRILKGHAFDYHDNLSQCETAKNSISIPQEKVLKSQPGLLIAYKVDTILKTRQLETFQLLKSGQNQTEINICPGNYVIRYMDLNHHLFWSINKKVD
jgi:hypothetical protein